MTFAAIAFDITDAGAVRELDAYETACALADVHRWCDKSERSAQPASLRHFTPDRLVLGGVLGAIFGIAVALGQIAGAI
jgi:hypothetical protein